MLASVQKRELFDEMAKAALVGLRVLIVEDEYLLATDLKRALMDAGAASVQLSGDLLDGAREVVTDGYAFALLDLNLRGDFAYPLADILTRRGIPFGFVTGFDRTHFPSRFAHVPFWQKPVSPDVMVRDIERMWINGPKSL